MAEALWTSKTLALWFFEFALIFDFQTSGKKTKAEGSSIQKELGLGEEADAGKKMPKRKAFAPRAWPSGPTHAGPIRPLSLSAAEYVLIFRSA